VRVTVTSKNITGPLRTLLLFILVIAATFLAGSILSCTVYLILSGFSGVSFYKVFHFSILLTGLVLGLYYLKASGQTRVLGLDMSRQRTWRYFLGGFCGGVVILTIVATCLFGLGLRQMDPDLHRGLAAFGRAVAAALLSGVVVGITEEILFRGSIFTGLARYSGGLYALIVSSVFYAAVHFLDFKSLPSGAGINFSTSITALGSLFGRFSDPAIYDSFVSLFVLGVLFSLARWQTGNIMLSAGLHAGIVTSNKIFSYAADYRRGGDYDFLVNVYDKTTGHLTTFWLVLACIIYFTFCMRRQPGSRH
jgi:hypothetical protein